MPARLLLIDDHQIIRDGLRLLLRTAEDLELVGNAYDCENGWRAVEELRPDLVVMDLNVPGEGGAQLTERIRRAYPSTKILVLTGHGELQHVQAALNAGAHGYVLKGNGFQLLLEAIRAVLSGKTYLCPDASAAVVQHMQRGSGGRVSGDAPSEREVEVLRQIANGHSTKEIAFNLGVSAKTIETHRTHLMTKLGLRSIAELTKYAVREGIARL